MKPKIFSIVFVVGMCVCTYAWGQTDEKKETKREIQIESTKVSKKNRRSPESGFYLSQYAFLSGSEQR